MRPHTMEPGMLGRAWRARKYRLNGRCPRYTVCRCPDFIGFSVVDRGTETWAGLWETRQAAWEWIDGTSTAPMLSCFCLRQVPAPLRSPSEVQISRYLASNPLDSCKKASRALGCPIDRIYRIAAEDGISFRERRERVDRSLVRLMKACHPDATDRELASFLEVAVSRIAEARKKAGMTHRALIERRSRAILQDLQAGLLWREIAAKHSVDEQAICVVARKHGIHTAGRSRGGPRRPPMTRETEEACVRLLRETSKASRGARASWTRGSSGTGKSRTLPPARYTGQWEAGNSGMRSSGGTARWTRGVHATPASTCGGSAIPRRRRPSTMPAPSSRMSCGGRAHRSCFNCRRGRA